MIRMRTFAAAAALALAATLACDKKAEPPKQIDFFSCDDTERIVSSDLVTIDAGSASEGAGCLKMVVEQPTTVPLVEVKFPGEGAKYTIQFKMRVKDFLGDAYGQMNVNYASGGKQEVKNYQNAIGATSDWIPMELSWVVQKGQKVDSLTLYAVLGGSGTVWVDEIRVIRAPLA